MIAEPDVTLTDWALSVEAGVLAILAARAGTPRAWVVFFGSIAVAALLGGISHGFFPDTADPRAAALRRTTLLALGVTSAAAFSASAGALLNTTPARRVTLSAIGLATVYAAVVSVVTDAFAVAIAAYLPATAFLFVAFVAVYRATGATAPLAGAIGVGVLLLGSWVQWRGIAASALGLGHNALYHVIEMIALPLLYRGARGVTARER